MSAFRSHASEAAKATDFRALAGMWSPFCVQVWSPPMHCRVGWRLAHVKTERSSGKDLAAEDEGPKNGVPKTKPLAD